MADKEEKFAAYQVLPPPPLLLPPPPPSHFFCSAKGQRKLLSFAQDDAPFQTRLHRGG